MFFVKKLLNTIQTKAVKPPISEDLLRKKTHPFVSVNAKPPNRRDEHKKTIVVKKRGGKVKRKRAANQKRRPTPGDGAKNYPSRDWRWEEQQ